MCKVLKVSRSGFYKWLHTGPSARVIANKNILRQIRTVYYKSKRTYGSPRITNELNHMGIAVSRVRVARLMRQAGIRSKVKKKYRITTDNRHSYPISPNLLERRFSPGDIGKAWVSDITYIRTMEGWLYLTTVIDLGDRKVIGWSLGSTLKAADTVIKAWSMAVKNRPITKGLIFHSDQGVQYACNEFRSLLKAQTQVKQSMSRKGNCWDNAVAESFFKTLKAECTNWQKFINHKEARMAVFEYIEGWYNNRRAHSALGYKSPKEFEHHIMKYKPAA